MFMRIPPVIDRFLGILSNLRDRICLMRGPESFHRLRRTRQRNYYAARRKPAGAVLRWAVMLVLAATVVFCAGKLVAYLTAYVSSRNTSMELREAYHEQEETVTVTGMPTEPVPSGMPVSVPAATPTAAPVLSATDAPGGTNVLPIVKYPNNPYCVISSRFEKVRRVNSDIIGWLTIPDLLDEAVVQRDNQYYLKRDYRGYHNVNGAIFLDENSSLSTRPYTLILYGHNMKTGAMFGCLRNYENATFYHSNPFITFDTVYEDGRYVIFSVATISIAPADWNCLNFNGLISSYATSRQAAINRLRTLSVYSSTINVSAEDQLLLLITCKEDENERRVIAARRIRDGEDEAELRRLVRQSVKE